MNQYCSQPDEHHLREVEMRLSAPFVHWLKSGSTITPDMIGRRNDVTMRKTTTVRLIGYVRWGLSTSPLRFVD